jgi:hypothetical protein
VGTAHPNPVQLADQKNERSSVPVNRFLGRRRVRSRWRNSMLCGFQAIDDKGGLTKVECVDALFGCATNCEGEVLSTGIASGLELDE